MSRTCAALLLSLVTITAACATVLGIDHPVTAKRSAAPEGNSVGVMPVSSRGPAVDSLVMVRSCFMT